MKRCLSNNPDCSGIDPCDVCFNAIFCKVLPPAMVAGGFNNDPEQAKNFFDAFRGAWGELHTTLPDVSPQVVEPQEGPSVHELLVGVPGTEDITANDASVVALALPVKKRGRAKKVVEE